MADDCTTRLAEARDALHNLITGQQVVSASFEGESVSYTQADRPNLEAYVARLEAQCGGSGVGVTAQRRGPARVVY